MTMRRSIGISLMLVALATAVSACTSDDTPAATATPPVTVPVADPASPIPAEATELPDVKTLIYQKPTQGSAIVGRAKIRGGVPLWELVTCHGTAGTEIEVELKPLDRFTVPCTPEGYAARNQATVAAGNELTVQVSSPGDATWSLRLQQ
ncbi:hypothetical protein [Asanoa ferruginea]|nr:hypothetical protein [Asanoa ferruginea]